MRPFAFFSALALAAAISFAPARAQAQDTSPVNPTGKGIAGGAMLGGELVMIVEAIIGVDDWWPYVVFGAVGAGGGAVGGYFVEQAGKGSDPPVAEPALYMLAGGMALIVPTVVAVLNATAYDPSGEADEEGDKPASAEPAGAEPAGAEPAGAGPAGEGPAVPGVEGKAELTTGSRGRLPLALLGVNVGPRGAQWRAGLPAVQIGPRFTPREMATYGLEQATEVNVPLVRGSF